MGNMSKETRKVMLEEYIGPDLKNLDLSVTMLSNIIPKPTGNWIGPYLFHEWGSYNGTTSAILEKPETGECFMAPVGHIKFINE